MAHSAYEAILSAARRQFAEVGYRDVTIRAIAAEAGYSAAMVMKLMGSKERLFELVAPGVAAGDAPGRQEPALVPKNRLGHELVRRIIARRRMGVGDPYAVAPVLIRSAPDPDQLREEIRERYIRNMAGYIGDSSADAGDAKLVVAMMFGFATTVHTLEAYAPEEEEAAIDRFAELVQTVIDRCDGPRTPLPDESVGISAARRGAQREEGLG